MAKFLTTRQTTSELESIITNARRELVLISPYIKIADNLFPSLQLADRKNVNITIVYGKKELDDTVRKQLSQLGHLTLRFLDILHAKCYYNETKMIISSLNLYNFSEGNWEMGILLDAQYDAEEFVNAKQYTDLIINASVAHTVLNESVREPTKPYIPVTKPPETSVKGYCMRSGEPIKYDVTHPLCFMHFEVWREHSNPDYKEHYCHRCGKEHRTTFRQPLCRSCQKNS